MCYYAKLFSIYIIVKISYIVLFKRKHFKLVPIVEAYGLFNIMYVIFWIIYLILQVNYYISDFKKHSLST